jgi:hypothetical protein
METFVNEQQFFEALGRKQHALEAEQADYRRFIAIIAAIKAGTVDIDDLTIDGNNWKLTVPGPVAEVPPEAAV